MGESSHHDRGSWTSNFGFILAAAGSAIGLGNLWRFPYITGENGGGVFVLIYLACIAFVGLPFLLSEIIIGKASGRSPVGAFRSLGGERSPWVGFGWLGIIAATLILSLYCVVAGWAMHYTMLAVRGIFAGLGPDEVQSIFGNLFTNGGLNILWALAFLALTTYVVARGVHRGLEQASKVLMPLLFLMLLGLLLQALTLDGFGEALEFVFGLHTDKLTAAGVLEALGHSFFTLGIGVGIMITYGSYLRPGTNIVRDTLSIAVLDTIIALFACLIIFPITFTHGLEPGEGPGLVFTSLPIAFGQMPGGALLATVFFSLLVFAALTSSISMLEVPTSYLIDERGWTRKRATLSATGIVALLVIPAALTGATELFGNDLQQMFGKNWFDLVFDSVSNLMMPIGGLGFAIFCGWRLRETTRHAQFPSGFAYGLYRGWLIVLRYFVPFAVVVIFLHAVGLI